MQQITYLALAPFFLAKERPNIVILLSFHTDSSKILIDLLGNFLFVDKQNCLVEGDEQIRVKQRIEGDIVTP